jgi:hypothetical protein
MQASLLQTRIVTLCLGLAAFAFAGWANADPPVRVARLGYIGGAVSFSPAGETGWVRATVNRPLVTGDHLWTDVGARAELQVGSAVLRLSGSTSATLLNLDDSVIQLQLAQGSLNVHVRRFEPTEVLEIDTPNLAFSILQPGDYRIDVDSADDATTVTTRDGRADVYGEDAAYAIDAQRSYRFYGAGLRDSEVVPLQPPDDFDRWSYERDRRWENSIAARYVSRDVIGYQDLDNNGTWRGDPRYGNIWVPNHVPTGWTPYRDGHWVWIDPWGWTWVDDAPWGFAVSHYGRWTNLDGTWGWVPGPPRAQAIYAPALVAFVGGRNFQLSISTGNVEGIAWFALGPRDVYRPTYAASRSYFTNINSSNTVINNTQITNVYNNVNVTNIKYVNRQVPGAIVAVPSSAFVQSQPVSKVAVRVSQARIDNAPVTPFATLVPVRKSVMGAAAPASGKPPVAVLERPIVARTAPPATPISFASKERLLAVTPGKPLDAAALRALRPVVPVAARVRVLAPVRSASPVTAGPPAQRARGEQRGQPRESPVAMPAGSVAPALTAVPEQRGRSEQRDQRPTSAARPQVVTPQLQQREQRGRFGESPMATPEPPSATSVAPPSRQRPQFEQHVKPTGPAAQSQAAAPPAISAPQEAHKKAEQRGKPEERPTAKAPSLSTPPPATPGARVEQRAKEKKVDAANDKRTNGEEQPKVDEEERPRKPER